MMRAELGDKFVTDLRTLYTGRIPGGADLVTYWFEKARAEVAKFPLIRAGLLATQGIRGGSNRAVLMRIADTARIFWAWSDRNWTLDGAAVHVSMIAFSGAPDDELMLDGILVKNIFPNLRSDVEVTASSLLRENSGISFIGDQKGGKFELSRSDADKLTRKLLNPNGRPNTDVIRPWVNGSDLTGRGRGLSIIDFGTDMSEQEAALYEAPFELVKKLVYPSRQENRREVRKQKWWLHHEPMPAMRMAVSNLSRFIVTPRVSKHRVFVWVPAKTLPDSAVVAVARDDDYFFGVLHSIIHETWARSQGTQVREAESGFRYTPNSTFDTFPFPWPPGTEPSETEDPRVKAIADAARQLVRLRDAWLNPLDTPEEELKKRTLTNLYNQRPTWLDNAHRILDEAVFAAYGWPTNLTTQQILANLLALNHERAAAQTSKDTPSKSKSSPKNSKTPKPKSTPVS